MVGKRRILGLLEKSWEESHRPKTLIIIYHVNLFSYKVFIHLLGTVSKELASEKEKYGEAFLENGRSIVPCYFSRGNHDTLLEDVPGGINLLENDHVIINTGGKDIVIGSAPRRVDVNWLDEFTQLPAYHILLCHYPELYEPLFKDRRIELIVSGHVHGGQIRIGSRGLYAPGQGLFPKYTRCL